MSFETNLSSIGTSVTGILQDKFANGIGMCSRIYNELFDSEDLKYERYFKTVFMPKLYEAHVSEETANCAFCSKLTVTSCHKHCLKCTMGTYVHCGPVLPGILCYESNSERCSKSPLPWLYRQPCSNFERLEKKKYYKNLVSHTSWVKLYNFEVLEGISNGIVEGKKPCHICAASDYEIYKNCLQTGNASCNGSPCFKAAEAIGTRVTEASCL